MKILVLGLGNELLGDDGAGIHAARILEERLRGKADVVESPLHGVALMEIFVGYDRAVVIDACQTGEHPPGTILELDSSDLRPVVCPSPHFTGLPEMFEIAGELKLEFPRIVKIFAVEAVDVLTLGAEMTEPVKAALGDVADRVERLVNGWLQD